MKKILFLLLLVSCAPRGDHKSLDQLYKEHLAGLRKVLVNSPDDTRKVIDRLVELSNKNYEIVTSQDLVIISDSLDFLNYKAGYTSRVAIHEMSNNFRNMSKIENINPNAVKLNLSRMLSLLTSELKTTKFKL